MEKGFYFIASETGLLGLAGAQVPWVSAMCLHTLMPKHSEVLVVEDMLEDARCVS